MTEQWWLARLDRYGNPTLCDGPHPDKEGVGRALHLYKVLKLDMGERYGAVRLEVFEVEPNACGVNEEAVETINAARAAG